MPAEQLFELRRRTFDAPGFRGMTFIEVEAKTVINRVPRGMPFEWTLNPYRGCSHACTYCLIGDTPILLADGRTRSLADLRVGDQVVGTSRVGSYRRYVSTTVLDHWQTMKPAYRIRLEDGTTLIASGDHRFLTERGWKHVTGAEHGRHRRPHLTLNNQLMGTGGFVDPPKIDDDYRQGYLSGMIRGDGHLGTYHYARAGRRHGDVHRFRLALTDLEPLARTREYLMEFGLPTSEFLFSSADGARREMRAIRTSAKAHVEAIRSLITPVSCPSESWVKGFLAGIFDAEGGFGQVIRIANGDLELIGEICDGLARFEFRYVVETARARPMHYVRVRGGLKEALRFFHLVDPVTTRKRTTVGRAMKGDAKLGIVSIEALGSELPMYDITTGTGDFITNGVVSHNCFARPTHTFLDMDAGRDFESKIVVKVNAPEVLRAQLRSKRWRGDPIAMGTATDPYQRAEGRYELMPGIIRALLDYRNPFSILTKGTLLLRDLDLLREAAAVTEVSTAFSIGTLDEDAWRRSEPGTPHPRARMDAVRALNEAGIPCGVLVAPILPGITDDPAKIRRVVEEAIDAGATHVSPILLHLRPGVREEYMGWLAREYPDLVPRYEHLYAQGSYASAAERKRLGATVARAVRAAGGIKTPTPDRRRRREDPEPPPRARQASLF